MLAGMTCNINKLKFVDNLNEWLPQVVTKTSGLGDWKLRVPRVDLKVGGNSTETEE